MSSKPLGQRVLRAAGVAAVPRAADLVDDHEEGPQGRGKTQAGRARRPRAARVHAPAPDMVWLTDITEHPTLEGKLYCCSIKDVFSNRIVGYASGPR